jgi:hypothetical protein
MAEKRYKVIGVCPIMGTDGKFIAPGEVVTLDPDDQNPGATNVQALIDGGHVEEDKSRSSSSGSTAAKSGEGDKGK